LGDGSGSITFGAPDPDPELLSFVLDPVLDPTFRKASFPKIFNNLTVLNKKKISNNTSNC
jgi:hypothetical protein